MSAAHPRAHLNAYGFWECLLDGVQPAAEEHGRDNSNLSHDVLWQHSCKRLGSFDLVLSRNENIVVIAVGCIIRIE